MKQVVQVKLLPTPEQASALEMTLAACNEAATWVSSLAYEHGVTRNFGLRKLAYPQIRARWGLGAQAAQHVIKRTCDAYATLKANLKAGNLGKPGSKRYRKAAGKPITFCPEGAQPYDDRCLSWQYDTQTVSIWTTAGRLKNVRFACSADALKTLQQYRKGESDLIERDGVFYLIATCEIPESAPYEPDSFIGVDLGIANIATTSTGYQAAGRGLNRYRKRQLALRAKLQKKHTKSAKRRLKERSRREARHAKNTNHIIAKTIVTEAERTSAGISLEELKGIRQRVRLRKPQRVTLHSWAFAQLGDFIVYKAKRAGVPLVFVDPAYTSQTCAECGHVDKRNRIDQGLFICRGCGVVAHADRNASHNIAQRGESVWNAGRESRVPAIP
ncbi:MULTISPECIES: RNA-guided endonuclease TnpB family protein [unclassified Streptomyces]|uniref:RNA-guided endonuclease InsQ/TnpB family protein n=1 Tax=unclassified Streptomyces TaxID=2593676 RepID=UPI00168B867C|nr:MULTISPECIES: RNA-guided endonuclease TnpB family protein [unclassified Streptomyces]MBD3009459.1 IS200/IS605 family element transposase accessory protein TnpB [Streptomyces sp. 5-10]